MNTRKKEPNYKSLNQEWDIEVLENKGAWTAHAPCNEGGLDGGFRRGGSYIMAGSAIFSDQAIGTRSGNAA